MENINNLVQIDKNLGFNILELDEIKDNQTRNIIKSLFIYFSIQREHDLFGYQIIDPVKFAKIFKHSRQNLFRHIDNPLYLERKNNQLFYKWDSYLENALFLLATTPIFEEYKGENEDNIIVGLRNYIILKEIRCETSKFKEKGKPKKTYYYKLDSNFLSNLKRFFFNVNVHLFLECRKINTEDFYLYITNIYNQYRFSKEKSSHNFNIDTLERFFNVSHTSCRIKKSRINKQLSKMEALFKFYNLPISFLWIKENNQKYAYTLSVCWMLGDKQDKSLILEKKFIVELKNNLKELYVSIEKPFKPNLDDFCQWLLRPKNESKIKEVFFVTFENNKFKTGFPNELTYFENFYSKLINSNKTYRQLFYVYSPIKKT